MTASFDLVEKSEKLPPNSNAWRNGWIPDEVYGTEKKPESLDIGSQNLNWRILF